MSEDRFEEVRLRRGPEHGKVYELDHDREHRGFRTASTGEYRRTDRTDEEGRPIYDYVGDWRLDGFVEEIEEELPEGYSAQILPAEDRRFVLLIEDEAGPMTRYKVPVEGDLENFKFVVLSYWRNLP